MTKYDMALALADAYRLPKQRLRPLMHEQAAGCGAVRRPENARLSCGRLGQLALRIRAEVQQVAFREAIRKLYHSHTC